LLHFCVTVVTWAYRQIGSAILFKARFFATVTFNESANINMHLQLQRYLNVKRHNLEFLKLTFLLFRSLVYLIRSVLHYIRTRCMVCANYRI